MRGIICTERKPVHALSSARNSDACFLRDVSNRPLIYFSISVLIEMGIRQIMITANAQKLVHFQEMLGSGEDWGLQFSYALTAESGGMVESILVSEEFAGDKKSCLVMGDKVFMNTRASGWIQELHSSCKATVLIEAYRSGHFKESEVGLVVLDSTVHEKIRSLQVTNPSLHDVLQQYDKQQVEYRVRSEEARWMDIDSSLSTTQAKDLIEDFLNFNRGMSGCPEEVCWRLGFIDDAQLEALAKQSVSRKYGSYLLDVLEGKTEDYPNETNLERERSC